VKLASEDPPVLFLLQNSSSRVLFSASRPAGAGFGRHAVGPVAGLPACTPRCLAGPLC